MTEAVTKTIVGSCQEISEKNGWTAFHIDVGSQWPVKLSTKVGAIIEQGRTVGTEQATWTFKESQGGENPNKPGTHFTNRYLDKVEAGSHPVADNTSMTQEVASGGAVGSPHPAAPQRPTEGTHKLLPLGDEKRAIVREACLHYAALIYQGKGADKRGESTEDAPLWQDEAVTLTIMAAVRMENWVMRDLDPEGPPF